MTTTYTWNCRTVDVHPLEGDESNVVYNIHWIVTGTSDQLDSDGNAYSASNIGTQMLTVNPEGEFVPFEDLTNDVVVGWTKSVMGEEQVTSIETSIQSQIDSQVTPTSITRTIGA